MKDRLKNRFWCAVAILIAARLLLAAFTPGHGYDTTTFGQWGDTLANNPWSDFYSKQPKADHLPGDLYFHGILAIFSSRLGIEPGSSSYSLLLKLSAAAQDILLAAVMYAVTMSLAARRQRALLSALAVLACPAFILVSGKWGQWDCLYPLLLAVSILVYLRRKDIVGSLLAALFASWSLLAKPQISIAVAIILLGCIGFCVKTNHREGYRHIATFCAGCVVFIQLICMPFGMSLVGLSGYYSLFDRLKVASEMYNGVTLGATNFWSAFMPGWHEDSISVGLFTARTLGHILFAVSLAFIATTTLLWSMAGKLTESTSWGSTAALMAFYMCETRCHERYLFPAVVASIAFAALSRKPRMPVVVMSGMFLSFTMTIIAAVRFIAGPKQIAPIYRVASFVNVADFILLLVVGALGSYSMYGIYRRSLD